MAQGINIMRLIGYAPFLVAALMMTGTSPLQAADPENLEFIGTTGHAAVLLNKRRWPGIYQLQ